MRRGNSIVGRVLRVLLKTTGFLLLFLLLLLVALRLPPVQTWLAGIAANKLSKQTDSRIEIERVSINFIDRVTVKGLYAEEPNGDTLLYIGLLNVNIAIPQLLKRQVELDEVRLEDAVVHIEQDSSGRFNFQYLVDRFASTDTVPKKAKAPFTIAVDHVRLENFRGSALLESGDHIIAFGELDVRMKKLDLQNGVFALRSIALEGLNGGTYLPERVPKEKREKAGIPPGQMPFPLHSLPVKVVCDKISISGKQVVFEQGEHAPAAHFDYRYLHGRDLAIEIRDVSLDSTGVTADIRNIGLDVNETVHLRSFSAKARFTGSASAVEGLKLDYNNSTADLDATVSYERFGELAGLTGQLAAGLDIAGLSVDPDDVLYFVPELGRIKEIQPLLANRVEVSAKASGRMDRLAIDHFDLAAGPHQIAVGGTYTGLPDMERLSVSGGSLAVNTSAKAVKPFLSKNALPGTIDKLGRIRLNSRFDGSADDVRFQSLKLVTDGLLQVDLTGRVRNATHPEDLLYDLDIRNIQTGYSDLLAVMDSVPDMLIPLDTIIYKGTAAGGLRDYDVNGSLLTPLGAVAADLVMGFNESFTNATYKGDLQVHQVEIGRLLGVEDLGSLSMHATLNGSGLSLDSLSTVVNANVLSVDYRDYLYEYFAINGSFDQKQFNGDFLMRDENISVDFNGLVNLNNEIPVLNFKAVVDYLDLGALNLMSDSLVVHLQIDADMTGIDPDDVEGDLTIHDVALTRGNYTWNSDTIRLSAGADSQSLRSIRLESQVLDAELGGDFSFKTIQSEITAFVDEYFKTGQLESDSAIAVYDSTSAVIERKKGGYIELGASVKHPAPLADLFGIPLSGLDSASVDFAMDFDRKSAEWSVDVPAFRYSSISVDSIHVVGGSQKDKLVSTARVGKLRIQKDLSIPGILVDAEAAGQQAAVRVVIPSDSGKHRLELNTMLESREKSYLVSLEEPLTLNRIDWEVDAEGPITLLQDSVHVATHYISSGDQALRLEGGGGLLTLKLEQFDLANLAQLVDYKETEISGIMVGDIDIGLRKDLPIVEGSLDINTIRIGEADVGNLALNANSTGNKATGTIEFSGMENAALLEAEYNLKSLELNANLDIERLNLKPAEPFLSNYIKDTDGYITGNIDMKGRLDKPDFTGEVEFFNASAFVVSAQTEYEISSGSISVTSSAIRPDIVLTDSDGRNAALKGRIDHFNFNHLDFDLKFNTDKFTFLNSKKRETDMFYGKFVAGLNATITGTPELPRVRASMRTYDGTEMTVQLVSRKDVMRQEAYILFYDGKKNYTEEQLDSLAVVRYKVPFAMDLVLNAKISENALLRLVIDPVTGDNLEVRGNADLVVRIPRNGNLEVTGIYEVQEGSYRFSYQSLLRRDFGIQPGSRIQFTGNIMDALLDIQARYETTASTYALVANEISSLSESDARSARRKSDVAVLLNIGGKLSAPELSFDIEIQDEEQSPVGSSAERVLASISENESELNKQVFSLLLFNSFTGVSNTNTATATGAGTALRSVGNMINNQLNKLAQKADGLEIDFDLDQYANALSESGSDITQIDLGIRQSLAQDRLVISVGSNIGLESGSDESALSNVAGDFVLEYKITEGGKYRVKVFQKADYDALNEDNVWKTGVGFSYQTTFGRQFFKGVRKSKQSGQKDGRK